jgi:two-component system cell cycle sensor histidine kinase/response regulator CckA
MDHSLSHPDQLVRGLTHRMNNILTLFHGYVGLMLENEGLDKNTRDGLVKIKEGARAASDLMDRTHSLVRPSAVVWREIDLATFVPMLRPCFEGMQGKRTRLEIECPAEVPPVWADAGRFKTALFELVRNACEATCATGGTVRIEVAPEPPMTGHAPAVVTSCAAQPIQWVSVKITDNGPGIPPEMEEKVFQPFFSTKRKQNAAGLGLNVASGCVQQLGGVLRHRSEPGHTCFQILLPSRLGHN